MKNFYYSIILSAFCVIRLPVSADPAVAPGIQNANRTTEDAAWERVLYPDMAEMENALKQVPDGSMEWYRLLYYYRETAGRKRREEGLDLIARYPNNPNQWQWLLKVASDQFPYYFSDVREGARQLARGEYDAIKYDENAEAAWNQKYFPLRSAFISSHDADPSHSRLSVARLRAAELRTEIFHISSHKLTDSRQLFLRVWDATVETDRVREPGPLMADFVKAMLLLQRSQGEAVLASFQKSPNAEVREIAEGMARVEALRLRPLDLVFTAEDGKKVDLEQMRGKVVLVEIWSTVCSGCVDEMPKIKALYDRYRDRGFEVVGVCFMVGGESARPDALKIMKAQGVNWPQWLLPAEMPVIHENAKPADDFTRRYGFSGMPVTWLLDQDGRLLATERDTNYMTNLESAIRKALHL